MPDKKTYTCLFPYSQKNAIIVDSAFCTEIYNSNETKYIEVKVKALIDTGANGTCISHRLASACNLERVSVMKIVSAQGTGLAPVYKADIRLPCGTLFENVLVTEVAGSNAGIVFSMCFPTRNNPIDFSTQLQNAT